MIKEFIEKTVEKVAIFGANATSLISAYQPETPKALLEDDE